MKCIRCGAECSENQAFCLKCGSPMHVVPDFNLIEAELADSVGKFMDSDEEAEKDESVIEEDVDIYGKTKNINIKEKSEDDLEDLDDLDDFDDSEDSDDDDISEEDLEYIKRVRERKLREEKEKKKKILIISLIAAAAVIVILILALVINGNANSYESHYESAIEYIENKNYDKAEKELLAAIDAAKSVDEKIQAREALYNLYVSEGNVDNSKIVAIVKELIDLNPNEDKYKEWLLKYAKDIPRASVSSGSYDDVITIELSAEADDIYYTLDGSKPNKNATHYTAAFKIETEGKTVLKAISYTDGNASEIVEYTYEISFGSVEAPVISPEGGSYSENTEITVTVPEGCKVYYSYDGSTPDENSLLYEGPVAMLRGNNVFSAVAISHNGTKSKVVSNVYNLSVEANYTYNQAEGVLINKLLAEGQITDASGSDGNGGNYSFSYAKTESLSAAEYYIINVIHKDANGNTSGTFYYGVDTSNGNVVSVTKQNNGSYTID